MLSHVQVIEAFGGLSALARTLSLDPKLTTHWGRRGIPAKYWPRIEETETGRRLGITAGRLMRAAAAKRGRTERGRHSLNHAVMTR